MNRVFAIFPLAALVALAVYAHAYRAKRIAAQRPIPRSSWGWMAPSVLTLAFLAVWGGMDLFDGWHLIAAAPVGSLIIAASGVAALRRDDVWDWYDTKRSSVQRGLKIALPLAIILLAFLVVELPFNSWMPFGGPSYFWLEIILMAIMLVAFYFLGQRHAALCGIPLAFFLITGIGQYFIKRFKNAAILPTDLMVLGTAAAVSKEYVFTLSDSALWGIACALACVGALSLVRPPAKDQSPSGAVLKNVGLSAASFALLATLALVPNYMSLLGVQIKYWYSIDYYQMQGFYPTFLAVLQDMPIKKPEGFSTEGAQALETTYADAYRTAADADTAHQEAAAQFAAQKPTVIVVMNESFSDLSVYDGMHAGYEGPQFFKTGFDDALLKGKLNVTVHGAGTCNTEFEFLTGNALGFIGVGKYPYSVYDLSGIDAIAAQFKAWGYDTCAIHPNYASNWNRDKIYPQMGFDQFLSIDDFGGMPNCAVDKVTPNEPHCEVFHSGVSDKETYDRMLQMIEENDQPQFFFDVTMANHGSYNQNNIPAEYQTHYMPADFEGEETPERLNEYLACVQKSDDDLKEFVEKLRKLDKPVVLVFFGDHQPSLSVDYNDYWYADEPEEARARRAFSTDYVIWANYDVAGRDQSGTSDETSIDLLGAMTLDLIGAPVSDYQAAQLGIRESIPSFSAADYQGADRQWYAPTSDGTYSQAYKDMAQIEYLNFATKV